MQTFFKLICKYKYSLLLYSYLLCICFYLNDLRVYQAISIILTVNSLFFIVYLLSKKKYTLWILVILAFFIAFDAYFTFIFKGRVTIGVIASIFETNSNEAYEFLSEILVKGLFIFGLTLFLIIMSQRELRQIKISWKIPVLYIAWFLFIYIPVSIYFQVEENFNDEDFDEVLIYKSQATVAYVAPIFYNDIVAIGVYINEMRKFKKYIETERTLPEGVDINEKADQYKKIFLVIGESSSRKHYSLYGYNIQTTPFLDSLYNSNGFNFNYYDAISTSGLTRESVKISLSFATPHSENPFFKNKNMIDLANDAGYRTTWISSQDAVGQNDSYIGFIASCADIKCFAEISSPNPHTRDDLHLIDMLKQNYEKEEKEFFVLHLMGSHMRYFERYDKTDAQAISEKGNPYYEYDRTIYHTDRFFRELLNVAKKDSSFLILYFSDHGEIINEGHGLFGRGSKQFEIPYMSISNKPGLINGVIERYIDKETNLLNNASSIYIMAQILGYNIPDAKVEKAIADAKYILHSDKKAHLFEEIQKEDK